MGPQSHICTSTPPHREAGGSTIIAAHRTARLAAAPSSRHHRTAKLADAPSSRHRHTARPPSPYAHPHRHTARPAAAPSSRHRHTARLAAAKRSNYSITAGEHNEPAERTPSLHLRPHGGRTHRGEGIDMPVPPTRRMELATRQPCTSTRRRHVRTLLPHRYSTPLGREIVAPQILACKLARFHRKR